MIDDMLFYKRMKKNCETQVELAMRMHLHLPDDKLLSAKLRISPKRVEPFLSTADPEVCKKVYNELMAEEERTPDEEYFCRTFTTVLIVLSVKAKMDRYRDLLNEGYSEEEAASAIDRTPTKMMEYLGMSAEDLADYAKQRVAAYCIKDKSYLGTHIMYMKY